MAKLTEVVLQGRSSIRILSKELQTEFLRKGIHLMIAFVPLFASLNHFFTMLLLGTGTLFYAYAEFLRNRGSEVFLVSRITQGASRKRDQGKFVMGPITLGLGAMMALLFYPQPAAAIAIYALAFGDGFASIFGKIFGKIRLPYSPGKTIAGTLTCFVAVYLVVFRVLGSPVAALILAATASFLESLPTGDMDNLLLPAGTGLVASLLII